MASRVATSDIFTRLNRNATVVSLPVGSDLSVLEG